MSYSVPSAIDLKNGGGSLQKGPYGGKVDVTFTVADEDFMEVVQGKLNPQKVQKLLAGPRFSCLIPAVKIAKTGDPVMSGGQISMFGSARRG